MEQQTRCRLIATIAHTAKGQKRADGVTPYIMHPQRVAELVERWTLSESTLKFSDDEKTSAIGAAYLHDVVEDTCLTLVDLGEAGVDARTLEIVDLLTKRNGPNEPETKEYYQRIAGDDVAILVKCADRCANLEDAFAEVQRTNSTRRWINYIKATYRDVLPMYKELPMLHAELKERLNAIEAMLERTAMGGHVGTFDCGVML